jgi:hypothetical protein
MSPRDFAAAGGGAATRLFLAATAHDFFEDDAGVGDVVQAVLAIALETAAEETRDFGGCSDGSVDHGMSWRSTAASVSEIVSP